MQFRAIFLLLFILISNLPAKALYPTEPLVRVRIINTLDSLNIIFNGNWKVQFNEYFSLPFANSSDMQILKTESGLSLGPASSGTTQRFEKIILTSEEEDATLAIADVPYGVGWWWGGKEDRIYSGTIHVYMDEHRDMAVTIHLPLEEYLKGVVPYEIGGNSPTEALKAQAVAARSEAVVALQSGLYGGEGHDLTSDVECQVFSGNQKRTKASDNSVDRTRGLVISEQGKAIHAFYASNCGGRSEQIKNVWPGRNQSESYMVSLPDNQKRKAPKLSKNWRAKRWIKASPKVFCNPERHESLPSWSKKNFRWTRSFSSREITTMLSGDKDLGQLKKVKVLKRGESGRIHHIQFIFEDGSFEKQGELAIRQLFSPSLRSSNFYVKKKGDAFTLHGAGWGHGVGMCQSGAFTQASMGIPFQKILKHYYPASTLLNIYK